MSTFKNNLPDDLKKIWELTRKLRIHTSPDTSDAWMRLEQRLDMKQNISSKIYSRKLFSFTKPKLVYAYTILFAFLLLTPIIYNQLTNISVYADRGSQKQVILNDGTIVSINSESILKYSREFNSGSRNVNLNGEGYCKYTDTMEEKAGGIEFHPRYEGKCIRYLKEYKEFDWNKNSLFWIVGGDIVN